MHKFLTFLLCFSVLTSACQSEPVDVGTGLEDGGETSEVTDKDTVEDTNYIPALELTVGIADLDMIFAHKGKSYNISKDDVTTACGAIDTTYITKSIDSDGSFTYLWKDNGNGELDSSYAFETPEYLGSYDPSTGEAEWSAAGGMTPVLSAQLNEWAKEGDSFELKWIQTSTVMKLPEPMLVETETVKAEACPDGSLTISDALEGEGVSLVGNFDVEIYYEGKLVGKTEISLAQ